MLIAMNSYFRFIKDRYLVSITAVNPIDDTFFQNVSYIRYFLSPLTTHLTSSHSLCLANCNAKNFCSIYPPSEEFIMFYSHLVLTKKGLLGRVWLAAQLGEGRIPKQFACDAQIDILCRNIEKPVAPFALRLSAHLMLGVTRVYSRKSTIILSDVNRVLGALQKLDANAFDLISPRRRKRSRVSVNRIADITLQSGKEAIARFETITFPSPKRTRRRSVDTTFKNITFLEGLSGKPTAISEELDGVIDLDSHLDMHFPTIHIGQMDMRSGSVDPENILSQSSPIFRAREQDITLPPSADLAFGSDLNLIDLDLDPFHADVSLSVEANTDGTPHNVSQEKFDDGSDEFRAAFAQNLSSTPIRSSGDGSAIMTMLNPAPLADPVEVSKQNVLGARGPLGTTKTSIQSIGRRRNRGTGERIKKRRSSTGTKRTSKRSARILSPNLIITDQTELSVQFLRDCLRDTSDIVLSPGSIRPIGRRKKLPEETLESILMRSNPLGNSIPEVREFWTNVMVKPFLGLPKSPANSNESEGPDQIPHPSISTSPPKPMGHDQQSVHYDPVRIGTPPTQMEEVLELTLEEDEIARNALKATDVIKSGSSNKERSIPSDQSGSGPSGGLSFAQSSSLESKAPEILRDNELEKVRNNVSFSSLIANMVLNLPSDHCRRSRRVRKGSKN